MKETLSVSHNRGKHSHLFNAKSPRATKGVAVIDAAQQDQPITLIIYSNKLRTSTSSHSL